MGPLSKRIAHGDTAAFVEFYDACADRLHHYLWALLGSKEDAEDVLQESFLRLARRGKRLAQIENLTAFIFTIARNEALRWLRRHGNVEHPIDVALGSGRFEVVCGQDFERAEAAALALARLSPPSREIIELKIFAGLTFREIAEITGSPQGTVASQYQAALEKMRKTLAKDWL